MSHNKTYLCPSLLGIDVREPQEQSHAKGEEVKEIESIAQIPGDR